MLFRSLKEALESNNTDDPAPELCKLKKQPVDDVRTSLRKFASLYNLWPPEDIEFYQQECPENPDCYAACPWASTQPPFLFPYPIPALLFYSYLGSPSGSTFLELLDHRVIPMPHLCLVYYYLLFFLSPPSLTHPISCTLLTLSPMSYSSLSYSSLLLTD